MPVIAPSRSFSGSELGGGSSNRILKSDVRTIIFNEAKYKDGVYLFILPPYKADALGNGVWYRVLDVRDNFGIDNSKERFVETPDGPVAYFAKQCKLKYKSYAEVQKVMKDGRDMKIYPTFGRTTKRVLFNTAFAQELGLGAHVIEIPNWGCADKIDEHHRRVPMGGGQTPLVCDPKQAVAVFFKLDKSNKMGNPWTVAVETSKYYTIPDPLCDSANLYNLDEVVVMPDKNELVEKLRQITPVEIFDDCMKGYPGFKGAVSVPGPAVNPASIPPAIVAIAAPLAPQLPVATAAAGLQVPSASIPAASVPSTAIKASEPVSTDANPTAGGITAEQAKQWLRSK